MNRILGRGALLIAIIPALLVPSGVDAGARPVDAGRAGHATGDRTPPAAAPFRNLPSSLLVTLRPGADLSAVDAAAAARGLARVAWNPTLRTAQYAAVEQDSPGVEGSLGPGDHGSHAGRRREWSRLARLGAELRRTAGVTAARPPISPGHPRGPDTGA